MTEELMKQQTPPPALSSVTSIEQQRAIQEVQGMMIMAKKFPRNEDEINAKIARACQRKGLAEVARYVYPKGGTSVQGPSIRLAETLARIWGNMLYGIQELSRRPGVSEMEAYAWDLESNTRRSIQFRVEHTRHTKKGSYGLEDPRDIYELTANMGARRVRACILGIIPGDVVEAAEDECEKTLKNSQEGSTEERIKAMVAKFQEMGVPVASLEKRLGHKIEATVDAEIIVLRKIFVSIRDGMGKKEDYFEGDVEQKTEEKLSALTDRLTKAKEAEAPAGATGNLEGPKPGVQGAEATPELQPTPLDGGPGLGAATPPVGPPIDAMDDPPGHVRPDLPNTPPDDEEPPPPEDPWGKKKQAGSSAVPKVEAGKKAKDYWLSENMVQCPPGGERAGAMTNVKGFCATCKAQKKCFLFKD